MPLSVSIYIYIYICMYMYIYVCRLYGKVTQKTMHQKKHSGIRTFMKMKKGKNQVDMTYDIFSELRETEGYNSNKVVNVFRTSKKLLF